MAIDFCGDTCAIQIAASSVIDNVFAGGGTFTGWVHARTSGPTTLGRFMDKSANDFTEDGWSVFYDDSAVPNAFIFVQDFTTGTGRWRTPDETMVLNTWQHIAVTYNRDSDANVPLLYIDGVSQFVSEFTAASGTAEDDSGEILTIGAHSPSDMDHPFDGYMEDLRLYDRILDPAEIEIIANGNGVDGIIDGLLGRWPMVDTPVGVSGQDFNVPNDLVNEDDFSTIVVPMNNILDDDLMFLFLASGGTTPTPEVITTPSGWTLINSGNTDLNASGQSTPSMWVFRKVADGESASVTVTGDQSCTKIATIVGLRGIAAVVEDVVSTINLGSGTAPVAPSVTAGGNVTVFRFCVADDNDVEDTNATAHPAGLNARRALGITGFGSNGVSFILSTELLASGSTGTRTFALGATEEWGCLTITILGGQGATNAYLKDYSNNDLGSTFIGGTPVTAVRPDLKGRRSL